MTNEVMKRVKHLSQCICVITQILGTLRIHLVYCFILLLVIQCVRVRVCVCEGKMVELRNLFVSPPKLSKYLLFIIYLKADFFTHLCKQTHRFARPLAMFCKLHYIDSTYVSCVSCVLFRRFLYFRLFSCKILRNVPHSVCGCVRVCIWHGCICEAQNKVANLLKIKYTAKNI